MYKIDYTIKTTSRQIEIIPFGDIHYSSPNCKLKLFIDTINYIKDTPNTYAIGMGDYIDCVIPKDDRFEITDSDDFIDNHVTTIRSILEPIKHKIICLLTGNHEYKLHTQGYGDPTKRLCRELDVKYAGFSAFIRIKIEPKTHQKKLIIYAHHGWTAGRKTGNAINHVENLAQYWDADIYLVGHSHKLWGTRQVRISWNGTRKLIFGNTGSFLETCTLDTTGYGERAGYPPCKLGCLRIRYYPYSEDLHISE